MEGGLFCFFRLWDAQINNVPPLGKGSGGCSTPELARLAAQYYHRYLFYLWEFILQQE